VADDDEKVVRYLLKEHEKSIKKPLEDEIKKLKAEIYDLKHYEKSKRTNN
jgi:hypothetical protein